MSPAESLRESLLKVIEQEAYQGRFGVRAPVEFIDGQVFYYRGTTQAEPFSAEDQAGVLMECLLIDCLPIWKKPLSVRWDYDVASMKVAFENGSFDDMCSLLKVIPPSNESCGKWAEWVAGERFEPGQPYRVARSIVKKIARESCMMPLVDVCRQYFGPEVIGPVERAVLGATACAWSNHACWALLIEQTLYVLLDKTWKLLRSGMGR